MTELVIEDGRDDGILVDNGLEILTPQQCLELLARRRFGRIAVTVNALPAVFPVNYALHDENIYFWTGAGTKLCAATHRTVVAFQIDDINPIDHTGWSVLVIGQAQVMPPEIAADMSWLPVRPWAGGERNELVQIPTDLVSGRRIRHDIDHEAVDVTNL